MRILRLKLSNFRQYKESEIFFPQKGSIGIIGNNGSGKSTILNAIRWALYGRYDGVTQKQLRRLNAPKNTATFVELDFVMEGSFYRIRRDLNTSSKRNYIEKNKELVASGITGINEYIQRLLKMDDKAFENCYYAKQAHFDSLIKMNESPRFQMISKLLNVDAIDKAADISRKKARDVNIYIATLEEFLSNEVNHEEALKELLSKQAILSKELANTNKELTICDAAHRKIKKSLSEYEQKYNLFVKQNESLHKLKTEKDSLEKYSLKNIEAELLELEGVRKYYEKNLVNKKKFISLNATFQEMNKIRHQLIDLNRLRNDAINKEKEHSSIIQSLEKINLELQKDKYINLENSINSLNETIANTVKKKDAVNNELIKQRSKIEFLGNKYREQLSDIEKINSLNEDVPCPTCNQPLKEHKKKQLVNLEKEKENIENEIRSVKKKFDDGNKILNKISKEENEHRKKINHLQNKVGLDKQVLQNRLKELNLELTKSKTSEQGLLKAIKEIEAGINQDSVAFKNYSEKDYKETEGKINALRPIYERMLVSKERIKKIKSLEKNKEKTNETIKSLSSKIKEIKTELTKIDFEEAKFNELKNAEQKEQQKHFDVQQKKNKITFALESLAERIKDCNKDIKLQAKRRIDLENKRKEHSQLLYLNNLLKQYKIDYLNKDISPTLSKTMSDLIEVLTNGKYFKVELDENFNIFLYRNNERLPISMFSEGEQQLVAIVQRLAISQLLSIQTGDKPLELIMLDEIFGSMDQQRQDSLIDMFQSLTRVFRQIIIVSHDEHVKDSFEHTMVIEIDEESNSKYYWRKNHLEETTWNEKEVKEIISENYN